MSTSTSGVRDFLAFDFGVKRVGVAVGNSMTRLAQPLRTVASEGKARFDESAYFAVRRSRMASQICRFFASGAIPQSMISSIVR